MRAIRLPGPFLLGLLLLLPAGAAASWQPAGDLIGAEVVFDLLEASDGTLYAGTYPGGAVFVSLDGGDTWNPAAPLPGAIMSLSLVERPDAAVVVGTFPLADLFVTTDRGQSWAQFPGPPSFLATEIHSLLQASNGSLYAGCAPDGHIFRSFNGGSNWIVSADLPGTIVPWCLAEGPPGTLWAGTVRGMGIFRSTDGGGSWSATGTFRNGSLVYDTPSIPSILPDTGGGAMYAGMARRGHGSVGGLFRSTDGGQEWNYIDGLKPSSGVCALLETAGGEIWAGLTTPAAGDEEIVYSSPDGGSTWASAGALAGAREVFALLETSTGRILAGTAPNGDIFLLDPAVGVVDGGDPTRPSFGLRAAPNPFRSTTTFAFHMPGETSASLAVYAVDGRLVRTLLAGPIPGGNHSIVWDGRGGTDGHVPAGVYFGVLRAGNTPKAIRKLVRVTP